MSFRIARLCGWALLMFIAGVATVLLRGVIDPLLPAGDWHGLLSGLFAVAMWLSLTWLLRNFARYQLTEFFLLPWWLRQG